MYIYPKADLTKITSSISPVFKFIEQAFWKWIEGTNPASEYREMYFGEDSIYDCKGAIQQAVEAASQEADETGKPVDLRHFDFAAIFEG